MMGFLGQNGVYRQLSTVKAAKSAPKGSFQLPFSAKAGSMRRPQKA
jgi:hypothetical protein